MIEKQIESFDSEDCSLCLFLSMCKISLKLKFLVLFIELQCCYKLLLFKKYFNSQLNCSYVY